MGSPCSSVPIHSNWLDSTWSYLHHPCCCQIPLCHPRIYFPPSHLRPCRWPCSSRRSPSCCCPSICTCSPSSCPLEEVNVFHGNEIMDNLVFLQSKVVNLSGDSLISWPSSTRKTHPILLNKPLPSEWNVHVLFLVPSTPSRSLSVQFCVSFSAWLCYRKIVLFLKAVSLHLTINIKILKNGKPLNYSLSRVVCL